MLSSALGLDGSTGHIHTLHHKPNTTTFFVGPRRAQLYPLCFISQIYGLEDTGC
jgi:hypothetical protein